MPLFDVTALLEEDEVTKDLDIPFRFGKSFDVNLTLKDGKWQKTDSLEVWSLKITSDNAYSLNFIFSELYLPEGGELYIFNEDGSMVYGPVTEKQSKHGKTFMTDIIRGESVIMQISVPLKAKEKTRFMIQNIIHGYKNLFDELGYGDSDQSNLCNGPNRDAECYRTVMGDAIDGIVQILLASGFELCSGSLLNNTAQNYKPYVLTAFHCIDIDENNTLSQYEIDIAEEWLVRFGFKHAECAGSTIGSVYTFDDTYYRAAWDTTDFALVELQDDILRDEPSVGEKVWLGWNRSSSAPTKGYYLHHPEGDVMKYAYDSDTKVETDYLSMQSGQNYWYSQLDIGLLEHGSSGSPIFDQNKKVVGQLKGGYPQCNGSKEYWHGCLHRSWTGGGTNETRLSNWLDPLGTGATTLNSLRQPTPQYSTTIGSALCSTTTLSVTNLAPGYYLHHWNYGGDISLSNITANPVQISPIGSGEGWVEAVYHTGWGTVTMERMNFAVNTISSNDIVASVQGQAPGACAQMHMLWYNSNSTIAVAGHEGDCDPFLGGNNPFAAASVLEYDWNVPYGWTWSSTYDGYVDNAEVEISPSWGTNPNVGDQVYIGVRARNGCGWSNWQYNYWVVVSGGGGMFLSISPNPTSGETILSIESGSPEEATLKSTTTESAFDENTEWDLEVYNNMQSLKLKKQKLKGKSTTINTQSWKEGVYMVRVKYKDEMLTGKLVVNK